MAVHQFELEQTIEVDISPRADGDPLKFRIEIFRDTLDTIKYRIRFFRYDQFRLYPIEMFARQDATVCVEFATTDTFLDSWETTGNTIGEVKKVVIEKLIKQLGLSG